MSWKNQLRGYQKRILRSKPTIRFRVVEWHEGDELEIDKIEKIGYNGETYTQRIFNRDYFIRMFGVTSKGTSVCVHITGFVPHFYVSIPEEWQERNYRHKIDEFKTNIHEFLCSKRKKCKVDVNFLRQSLVKRKKFYGFTNNKLFPFLKLDFKNKSTMNKVVQYLKDNDILGENWKTRIYESNIPPFFRFIHTQDIQPAMWVEIPKDMYVLMQGSVKQSRCQLDITTNWKNVNSLKCTDPAPMLMASFDIECDSSHGDFPLAVKTMKKTASEIVDIFEKKKSDKSSREKQNSIVNDILQRGFYYDTSIPIQSLSNHLQDVSKIYTKDGALPSKELIKKVSENVVYFLNNKHSYSMLSEDILRNSIVKDETLRKNGNIYIGEQILHIILEAFADEGKKISDKYDIRLIYTRGNRKPTKSAVKSCAGIIRKHISKVILYVRNELETAWNKSITEEDIKLLFEGYEPLHQRSKMDTLANDSADITGIMSYLDYFS